MPSNLLSRRGLLAGLTGAGTLALLGGCDKVIEAVAESCPTNPADSGGVTWIPDAGHPVFWGVQDLTVAAHGVPRNMMIYYPTYEGFTAGPPILKLCVTRYPVVLFLHGQPPLGTSPAGWYRKWSLLPATLARCGYVVVVPDHDANLPDADHAPQQVADAMRDLDWVRTTWSDSNWVDKRATSTAVVGHSFGALIAAKIATAHPEIGAYVSLSGPYGFLDDPIQTLQALTRPSMFMWARGDGPTLIQEELDGPDHRWDLVNPDKYSAIFAGEHFDYLRATDTGTALRGPCSLVGGLAADLTALFISAHVPVSISRTVIPVDLRKPSVALTPEQEFFAGAHLATIDRFGSEHGCSLDLKWKVDGTLGSRHLGA